MIPGERYLWYKESIYVKSSNSIPIRPLGKTGVNVPILCLGGWHIGSIERLKAIRIMHTAIDEGLTFFDNSWDYHDGGSERVMGEALKEGGKRKKVFLMTKNCERDYKGSMKCLEDSLRRLKTDHIDLWQFHEINYDDDPDWIFEKGGIKAAIEAKKSGKVRFVGFTGHKDPKHHLSMLDKNYQWDACQMPINALDFFYRSFQKMVLPVCQKKNVGAIGMKSLGGGNGVFVKETDLQADALIRYSLSQTISSLVIGITSIGELMKNISIARDFKPIGKEGQALYLSSVKKYADGKYERFKSSTEFDGPHHRDQHGIVE